jgi:hypothetical protein
MRTLTLKDLMKEAKEPVWIIADTLPVGLTSLCGENRIGKTWFALDMCMALASGRTFFKSQATDKISCLYVNLTTRFDVIASRIKKLLGEEELFDNFFVIRKEPEEKIGLTQIIEMLDEQLALSTQIKVVVIDNWMNISGGPNPNILPKFREYATRKNIAIIMMFGTKKETGLYNKSEYLVSNMVWLLQRGDPANTRKLRIFGSYKESVFLVKQTSKRRREVEDIEEEGER